MRKVAVEAALRHTRDDGTIPDDAITQIADVVAVSTRTLRRWVARGRAGVAPTPRPRFVVNDDHLAVIASTLTLTQAHAELRRSQPDLPSYHTLRRALHRLDSGVVASITAGRGTRSLNAHQVHMRVTVKHPLQRWVMDSQEIPVRIADDFEPEGVNPHLTTAIDEATRLVMATHLTRGRPNSDDVAVCIASAVHGHTAHDGTWIGGIPAEIVWDNAAEFLSDQVTAMALKLGILPSPATPYAPWEKGKVEAWHGTIQRDLCSTLPGFIHGPTSRSSTTWWRTDPQELLTLEALDLYVTNWSRTYNEERRHSSLRNRTPLQVWKAAAPTPRVAAPEALFDAMLREVRGRTVTSDGVRFRNRFYVSAAINPHVKRKVHVRYLPHDISFVEVFWPNGEHIGRAHLADQLTIEERQQLLEARRDQYLAARTVLTDGQARRQAQHARQRSQTPVRETKDDRAADQVGGASLLAASRRTPATPAQEAAATDATISTPPHEPRQRRKGK